MSGPILLILRIIFAISLYAFLAFGLYMLWLDTQRQIKGQAQRLPAPLFITTMDHESSEPLRFTTTEITIGRDPSCSLCLEDITVSAQHARLTFRQGQWWLEDFQSTNGTFLNQETVKDPLVVTTGDIIRCGQAKFTIQIETISNGSA